MKGIYLILFIEVFFAKIILSQVSFGGKPVCLNNNKHISGQNIFTVFMPIINNDSLKMVDSLEKDKNQFLPPRIGISIPVNIDTKNYGTWDTLANGTKIWRLKIVSKNAQYIALFYNNFWLPPNSKLFIYSEDGSNIIGAFTERSNKVHRKFSTAPVKGESVIIEYSQSPEILDTPVINITTILYIDKIELMEQSASCMIDVKCSDGNNWCNQRRSVAMIISSDARICTGSLITNERRDGRPYFLTAEHCMDIDGNYSIQPFEIDIAQNWLFVFNYQRSKCSTGDTHFDVMSGATVKSHRYKSDFVLLELDEMPPGDYNVYYNGFNNANNKPKEGACIHHPLGDVKKISIYDNNPDRENCKDLYAPDNHKTWRVKWEKGDVQKGSSGAPLFNENKLVVGQLYGRANKSCDEGVSDCNDKARSFFGRFDLSWDDGNSSSERLRDWLSPNSSSSSYIESMSGDELCKSNYYFQNANDLHTSANINGLSNSGSAGTRSYNGVYIASGTIETGQNVTIQSGTSVKFYGKTIILNPGFTVKAGSNFITSPQPCLRGCNTGVGKMASLDFDNDEAFITLSSGRINQEGEDTIDENISYNEDNLSEKIIPEDYISIKPNPNNGNFTMSFGNINNLTSIEVINMQGVTVYGKENFNTNTVNIDISGYSKGIYFIKIIREDNIYTEKIIYN